MFPEVREFCRFVAAILRRGLQEAESEDEVIACGADEIPKRGRKAGRPRVTDRPGFLSRYQAVLERLRAGAISKRQAARELGVGDATFKRLLNGRFNGD